MEDKQLEQIGHFIGKTRAEVLVITDNKIKSAIEALQEDTALKQQKAIDGIGELNKELVDSVNDSKANLTSEHVKELQALNDQIKAQEIFETQLTARLDEIKDGEKGEQGERGNDGEQGNDGDKGEQGERGSDGEKGEQGEQGNYGEDGQDRPLLEPVQLKQDKDYEKNILGTYNGGLWISTKKAVGDPHNDPHAWHCILDAMSEMTVDLQNDHTFKLSARMASGDLIEDTFEIPFPEHKGIWEECEYHKGNIVTKGHSMWQAMQDTDGCPPGNGWQQILSAPRGKQGPQGKSITGPQGKPGRNGSDAIIPDELLQDIAYLKETVSLLMRERS